MSADVPLLSEYKKKFVRNRLLQTFLGGIRVTNIPPQLVIAQIALYLLPLLILVPISVSISHGNVWEGILTAAVLILFTSLLYQGILWYFNISKRRTISTEQEEIRNTRNRHLFTDEDIIDVSTSWTAVFTRKKRILSIFVHGCVAALTAACAVHFLRPDVVQRYFPASLEWTSLLIFGWVSVANSLYSVQCNSPQETATYRALDTLELSAISRPVHVMLLILPEIVLACIEGWGNFAGVQRYWYGPGPWIWMSRITHVALASLPLAWLLGLLPPIDSFIFWFGEQLQIFALGGSATFSTGRFIFHLILSILQFVLILTASGHLDITVVVAIASLSGYILSLNIWGGVNWAIKGGILRKKMSGDRKGIFTRALDSPEVLSKSTAKEKYKEKRLAKTTAIWKEHTAVKKILFHTFTLVAIGVIAFLGPYDEQKHNSKLSSSGNDSKSEIVWYSYDNETASYVPLVKRKMTPMMANIGIAFIVTFVFMIISKECGKVYCIGSLFRNPLYSSTPNLFRRVMSTLHVLVSFCAGFLSTFHLKNLFANDIVLQEYPFPQWIEVIAIIRAMRWIWQSPNASLVEIAIFHIAWQTAHGLARRHFIFHVMFYAFSVPVQLLLLSFLRDRFKQILDKIYFTLALSVSAMDNRSSRRSYAGCLFQINILLCPVIAAFILFSAFFCTPLLALFTLPVFFVAFPRPCKFWPNPFESEALQGQEALLYKQMATPLLRSLHQAGVDGRIGDLSPAEHFICRIEDRIIWIQVLEQGNSYGAYGLKGLELQETSCHSLEATRLDEIFDAAFINKAKLNRYSFHTITPLLEVPVNMYKDTKNVLTGVISATETQHLMATTYLKTLTWYLTKYIHSKMLQKRLPNPGSRPNSQLDLPRSEKTTLVTILPRSGSIEAVELDKWPSSSDSSPNDEQIQRKSTSSSAHVIGQGLQRKTLLPPISSSPSERKLPRSDSLDSLNDKLDQLFLPGGVMEKSPQPGREIKFPQSRERTLSVDMEQQANNNSLKERYPFFSTFPDGNEMHEDFISANLPQPWCDSIIKHASSSNFSHASHNSIIFNDGSIANDSQLCSIFKDIIAVCFGVLFDQKISKNERIINANKIATFFAGEAPSNAKTSWIVQEGLFSTVITPAWRAAVKLGLDQAVIGPFEDLEEFVDAMRDLELNWHLGSEADNRVFHKFAHKL